MILNNKGQITVEYILLIGVLLVVLSLSIQTIYQESEKNTILYSAQMGANEAIDKNAFAIYYNDTFINYQNNYQRLLTPTEIKIIDLNMNELNKKLELEITLHSNTYLSNNEKYIIGSRVNYYIRKSIYHSFHNNTTNDTYYENLITNNYLITTKTAKWV